MDKLAGHDRLGNFSIGDCVIIPFASHVFICIIVDFDPYDAEVQHACGKYRFHSRSLWCKKISEAIYLDIEKIAIEINLNRKEFLEYV